MFVTHTFSLPFCYFQVRELFQLIEYISKMEKKVVFEKRKNVLSRNNSLFSKNLQLSMVHAQELHNRLNPYWMCADEMKSKAVRDEKWIQQRYCLFSFLASLHYDLIYYSKAISPIWLKILRFFVIFFVFIFVFNYIYFIIVRCRINR